MSRASIEQLFAAYREEHDRSALGEVFDATAPELFKLAVHLVQDPAWAEDLVQATFLAAIESASAWRAGTPVFPWLLGILVNKLRMQRRRIRQPMQREPSARVAGPDPVAAAQAAELEANLDRCLAGMAETYRTPLILHLKHHLSPNEIAAALDRPAGTVRSQLSRGLEQLRRALPPGIGALAAVGTLSATAFGQLRAAVLGHAASATTGIGGGAAATGTVSLAGIYAMNTVLKLASGVAIAAVAVGVSVYATTAPARTTAFDGSLPSALRPPEVEPLRPARETADATAHAIDTPAEREQLDPVADNLGPAATVTFRGRCIDQLTGQPVAGCRVEVHGSEGGNVHRMEAYLKSHRAVVWEDLQQTTGPDGRFSLRFVPPPPLVFALGIRSDDFVSIGRSWLSLAPGTIEDFGDIELQRGSRVEGRITDSSGAPQDEVELYLRQRDRDRGSVSASDLTVRGTHRAVSRADGTFAFDEPVVFGTWNVKLGGEKRQEIAPESLSIPMGQAFTVLAVELGPVIPVDTITGIVSDEAGMPVRGVDVGLAARRRGGALVRTDGAGRFVVMRRPGDTGDSVRLRFSCDGFEDLSPEELHNWGEKDLEFVMRRGVGVEIVVTDVATGEPIEEYGVRCFPGAPRRASGEDFRLRDPGRHPEGRLWLRGIERGPQVLVVEPFGDTWQLSDFIRFEVGERGAPAQRVGLHRAVTRTLRLQYDNGVAVAGSEVELLRPLGSQPVKMWSPAQDIARLGSHSGPDKLLLVMKARTDAKGELTLRGPPGDFVLRLLGPGHEPFIEPDVTLAADAPPLVLTVSAGATVRGRLGPPELLQRLAADDNAARIQFLGIREGRQVYYPSNAAGGPVPLNEDGSFEVKGVPAGAWELHLCFWVRIHGGKTSASEPIKTLGDLESGEVREITADVRHLVPVRVTGVLMRNGEPLANGRYQLDAMRPDGHGSEKRIFSLSGQLDAEGSFVFDARPATYHIAALVPSESGDGRALPAAENLVIHGGRPALRKVFHVSAGSLRLRVVGGEGRPLSGVRVWVTNAGAGFCAQTPPTDAQGRTRLGDVLLGTMDLAAMPKHLAVPPPAANTPRPGVRELRLPDGWKKARVSLGRAVVGLADDPAEVELVMPASAGY